MCVVPDSTNIAAVGYNKQAKLLRVRFRDGSEYEYEDFGPLRYSELMAAESIGQHFAAHVRGKFTSVRRKRARPRAHKS